LEQDFKHGLNGRVSLFHNDLSNLIGEKSASPLVYGNVLDIRTTGVEGELTKKFVNGVRGFVNGTWQTSDFNPGPVVNSPTWIANAGIVWPVLGDKLSLAVRENYVSSRTTFVPGEHTGDAFETDLTVASTEWLKHWSFDFSVKNLLNDHFKEPANPGDQVTAMPTLGRTVLFRTTYRF